MSRSSDRGYVEPLAALAALLAVVAGLTMYVGSLEGALAPDERPVAETVAAELVGESSTLGVLDPAALRTVTPPPGWHANVTLATRDGRLERGPIPPAHASVTTRRVSVRLGPGTVRPGRLTVEAWQ